MKGILLAGGSGTRLYPVTQITSKQLLPVYDKPMIYYALSVFMLAGVREILIISTDRDLPQIEILLGDGKQLGIDLKYAVQEAPRGLPEAFIIGESFIAGDDVMLVLGDNIFYGDFTFLRDAVKGQNAKSGGFNARIFSYYVDDPKRYGVVEFDRKTNQVLSLEEKPERPKSKYAIPGLYLFDSSVARRANALTPPPRGELEIIDLMKSYLRENQLSAEMIGRGVAWLDAGTPESMLEASHFIAAIERRQGLKIACLEEIALRQGFLDHDELSALTNKMPNSSYRDYLLRVLEEIRQ